MWYAYGLTKSKCPIGSNTDGTGYLDHQTVTEVKTSDFKRLVHSENSGGRLAEAD